MFLGVIRNFSRQTFESTRVLEGALAITAFQRARSPATIALREPIVSEKILLGFLNSSTNRANGFVQFRILPSHAVGREARLRTSADFCTI